MVAKRRLRDGAAGPPDWQPAPPPPCPLCGRVVLAGPSADVHHWVPRSEGGRTTPENTALLHRVCHRKLHATFSERELARDYAQPLALLAHPEIASFVRWVQRQPPAFVDGSRRPARR
jgi:5-methylcytosine-specific restriction endonuclease McrA